MDGEVGRFTFKTYDVKAKNNKPLFAGIGLFPTHKGRQWYPTSGFKEVALIYGAVQRSAVIGKPSRCLIIVAVRKLAVPTLNTRCDVSQAEGLKVLDFLTRKAGSLFKEQGFNPQGLPDADCTVVKQIPDAAYLEQETLQPALTAVCEDMVKKGLSVEDIEKVQLTPSPIKPMKKLGNASTFIAMMLG